MALEDIDPSKLTSTDRAALMTMWLGFGRSFTLAEAAQALGYGTEQGAWKLLDQLSRWMPIYTDGGRWQCLPEYVEENRRVRAATRRREAQKEDALRAAWGKVFDRERERV